MASDYSDLPQFLATREGEAYQSQFSTSDYGRVGDQRPYQIVSPGYPAPKFLAQFEYLDKALDECGTLCQLTGRPFRLVKWGSRLPCYPCRARKSTNALPAIFRSPTLQGYPNARSVADFHPNGTRIVWDNKGRPHMVGAPNYVVSRTSTPPSDFVNYNTPLPTSYKEAVFTAQKLANDTGSTAYICSSTGASCKRGENKAGMSWTPVVYVQPGGLVRRYPQELSVTGGATSSPGSQNIVKPVTENEFRELIRESMGRTRLGYGS